jgi:predicted transcriptional regulator
MTDIVLSLSSDLLDRLDAIALQQNLPRDQCAHQAILDYIECWEDFRHSVDSLEAGEEERTVLRAVNE